MSAERLARLRELVAEAELDAVAMVPGPNLVYFIGLSFHLSERPVLLFVPARGQAALLLPGFEAGKAEALPFPARTFPYDDTSGPAGAMAEALRALGLARSTGRRARRVPWLGVEARRMRYLELALMAEEGRGPQIFEADELFAALRMRKGAEEIAAMREAARIAEAALEATLPMVRAGASERAIARELFVQLLRAGSEVEIPFAPIVAGGPNGAKPHATPSDRPLAPGDLVTIDWGAAHAGYYSDITRSFAIGGAPVDPRLLAAYEAVERANRAGREAAGPGATGEAVDRAARAVIVAAGLGEHFTHRTGHGLGLEGHEDPYMREGDLRPLEPGMTFTVEPGVYIPALGGVRIEDDVVITAAGAESLTTLPRALITLGP